MFFIAGQDGVVVPGLTAIEGGRGQSAGTSRWWLQTLPDQDESSSRTRALEI